MSQHVLAHVSMTSKYSDTATRTINRLTRSLGSRFALLKVERAGVSQGDSWTIAIRAPFSAFEQHDVLVGDGNLTVRDGAGWKQIQVGKHLRPTAAAFFRL